VYISQIYANGFRCFGPNNPLTLDLRRGLNILVGPNDAGKTAIIDIPRYVLWTRGDDYVRMEPSDFYVGSTGDRATELLLRCTFDGLTPDEESRFLEWCTNEQGKLRLHVCARSTLRKLSGGGTSAPTIHGACYNCDGLPLQGDIREYLRATYLRPLRDAERELRAGRRSRLSRILGAMPVMKTQSETATPGSKPTLRDTIKQSDDNIEQNDAVENVRNAVNTKFLDKLSFLDDPLAATLGLGAKGSFDQILERFELYLNPQRGTERVTRGLGYNNLLFMAAELLLLQSHAEQVPFLLIEEPEAHLHPQHQTLFMQLLEERTVAPKEGAVEQQVQVLLSTHSPQLAAGADLENLNMILGHAAYPLSASNTALEADDYAFLRRFLDATKANLFFARGLLIVEGDAENLLLPAIAKKLGRPLSNYGVSIVKVGHRGLFRYARILQRKDGKVLPVPVALIPDRDIPPDAAEALAGKQKTEGKFTPEELATYMAGLTADDAGCVKSFPSEQWTLEFDLARSPGLASLVYQAIALAKGSKGSTREQIKVAADAEVTGWQEDEAATVDQIATKIFEPLKTTNLSKAQVAEQLARLIEELKEDKEAFRKKLPAYLVSAIDYATGNEQSAESGVATSISQSASSASQQAATV
jgi:putative ATP-dependent endonuclease of OLD family